MLTFSLQASVTSVLALASDRSLAAAATDVLPVNSPLLAMATCRSVSAYSHNAPVSPTPSNPDSLSRLSRGLSGDARSQRQRFNVLRESASGDRLVLIVQPCSVVPGKSPRKRANLAGVAGTSPRDLRSTILSLLLESNPNPLPAAAQRLSASAIASTQQQHHVEQPFSPMASTSFPRLAAVLQLDTVASLAILGRLFTAASDAVRACVWLAEGVPGVVARRRCLPGEWPALAVSAETVDIRIQAPKVGVDQQADAPSKEPPTLQSILQAIAEIALGMAVSERLCVRPSSSAFHSGGTVQSLATEADALELSASSVSPRLGLLLLFIAYQICRNGPGIPPVVLVDAAEVAVGSRGVIATVVRLAALYLCSPAPRGMKVLTKNDVASCEENSADVCSVLSDSSWVLHDDVIHLLVSFTSRGASSPVAAAWDTHSDDELFCWKDARNCSTPVAPVMLSSRREELLVRLLRSIPVSSELRAALAERASAAGQFAALAVLRALEGDAVAVIDAFLQASVRGRSEL